MSTEGTGIAFAGRATGADYETITGAVTLAAAGAAGGVTGGFPPAGKP